MAYEISLFWVAIAGLLFIDNLVLVPHGGDYLKVGRLGRFHYEVGTRFKARRRDLVLLNPLNPFDRLVVTQRSIGTLSPEQLHAARKLLRDTLHGVNLLSWLGSGYLAALVLLAVASLQAYFGVVLAALAVVHLLTWAACLYVLVSRQPRLLLSRYQTFSLAVEALLVPGYLVNLGKRVWFRHVLDLAALTLGLRQLRRMPDDSARELYGMRMASRLEDVAYELDLSEVGTSGDTTASRPAQWPSSASTSSAQPPTPPGPVQPRPRQALQAWLTDARRCLTTLAPPAGL